MNKKSGRKPLLTEDEIREIIYWFRAEPEGSPTGIIKAAPIYEFTNKLYSEGRINHIPSLDFWYKPGRLGTKALDEANKVFASSLSIQDDSIIIPRVVDLVQKRYRNKEELINNLLPLEKLAIKLADKVNSLTKKLNNSEDKIAQLTKQKEKLQAENLDLEEVIFKLFRYIQNESNEKTKKLTARALELAYEDPMYFYKKLEDSPAPKPGNITKLSDKLKFNS